MLTAKRNILRYSVLALLALAAQYAGSAQENNDRLRTISANRSRPVSVAVSQLRERYGWLISYQDPPYEHPDELMLHEGPPTKHMIPRRMNFSVEYTEPQVGDLEGQRRTIEQVVAHLGDAGAGQFRVYHFGTYSYVLPVSVKRANGVLENLPPICEMTVSFPPAMRTIDQTIRLILPRISQRVHSPVLLGAVPINLFLNNSYLTEAADQPVCDLIARVLDEPNVTRVAAGFPPAHRVWDLLYDPTDRDYAFSVVGVVPPKGLAPGPHAEPRKADR